MTLYFTLFCPALSYPTPPHPTFKLAKIRTKTFKIYEGFPDFSLEKYFFLKKDLHNDYHS